MKRNRNGYLIVLLLSAAALVVVRESNPARADRERVTLVRTPDGGIQPQVAVDRKGALHLIYFKGDPAAGDIFYVRRDPGKRSFSKPLRVNSVPGAAVAIGSVRGPQIAVGQLAVGKPGRVHIVWLGSTKAQPRGPGGATPMLYTRLNDAGTSFEPERNVMQFAVGLDGGGSVAADRAGNIDVVWHGNPAQNGEANRRVWIARSSDEGKTFSRETPAYREPTGACGCCGMKAFADAEGRLYILYRAATELVHRDMYLLVSKDGTSGFRGTDVAPWNLNACPMSTASIGESARGVLAAWETAGQVYYDEVNPSTFKISSAVPAPGEATDRKHPAVAGNARGETILAWTEGTGWQKGGAVAWQVFDPAGRPLGKEGHADGVPVWGLVAAFANQDGGFTVVY